MNKIITYINQHYTKVIGWGTSENYRKFSKMLNVDLAYLVDGDVSKWGTKLDNKAIYSPDILMKEDPDKVLIIIFSVFYDEIYERIREYGQFYAISGEGLVSLSYLLENEGDRSPLEEVLKDKQVIITISRENFILYTSGLSKFLFKQTSEFVKNGYVSLHINWQEYNLKNLKGVYITILKNGEMAGIFSLDELNNILMTKTRAIVIHNLISMDLNVLHQILETINPEATIIYYLHDYSCICSNIKLMHNDEYFCKSYEDNWKACDTCINQSDKKGIYAFHRALFDDERIKIVAPSLSTKRIVDKAFNFHKDRVMVIPHQKYQVAEKENIKVNDVIKIAYVGYKHPHKGWETFKNLVKEFKSKYEFYCLGRSDEIIDDVKFVEVPFGKDEQDAMTKKLIENEIDIALLWSTWPETYAYTYFESFAAGTWVITNNLSGNIAEQVKRNKNGIVLNDYDELKDLLSDEKKVREYLLKNNKIIKHLEANQDEIFKLINYD